MLPDEAAVRELERAAATLGVALDAGQIEQLLGHLTLLIKWNKVYNLTAIRDPADMLRQHLIDSLSVVPSLLRHLHRQGAHACRLLDVGSGAGFPGLTIAMAMPQCEVTCVDSVGKKVGFIRQVIAELGLSNARAEHGRVEALPLGNYDVITSRAFASLEDFTRLTRSHLGRNGSWMALKGRQPDDEITSLPPSVEMFHVEQLHPPGMEGERCLVWLRPPAA